MNVFDFDGTIYKGDSSYDFVRYCLKKYPKTRRHIPSILWYGAGYGIKLVKKKTFKQKLFAIVSKIENLAGAVADFWALNKSKIKKWYLDMKKPTDVIISASPEFLLAPICTELGVECMMGTKVNERTGLFESENCVGAEKVVRFYEMYPDGVIDEFYSDRYIDTPVAQIAKKAVFVKGDKLLPWKKGLKKANA